MPYPFVSHVPYYHQIKEDLRRQILSGSLPSGEKLMSEPHLADHYGVSRTTVRQAVQELVEDGFLVRVRGKGTFVRSPVLVDDAASFTVFPEEGLGEWGGAGPYAAHTVAAPEPVARELELAPGSQVYEIRLRHLSHGQPVAVRTLYLPCSLAPDLLSRLDGRSLAQVLEAAGLYPAAAVQRFQAVGCPPDEAPLLDARPGDPVMVWQGVVYGTQGSRVAYVRTVFRGDRVVFVIRQEHAAVGLGSREAPRWTSAWEPPTSPSP